MIEKWLVQHDPEQASAALDIQVVTADETIDRLVARPAVLPFGSRLGKPAWRRCAHASEGSQWCTMAGRNARAVVDRAGLTGVDRMCGRGLDVATE
jgi:hypothetical protein